MRSLPASDVGVNRSRRPVPRLRLLVSEVERGVRDGRAVEVYIQDPEGQRIDLAPHWLTRPGERRQQAYQTWQMVPAERA